MHLSLSLCVCVSNNKPIHCALYNSWRSDAFHIANCYKFNRKIRKWDLKCSFHNFHLPFTFSLWTNTLVRASLLHFNMNSMETMHFWMSYHNVLLKMQQKIAALRYIHLNEKKYFRVEKASKVMKYCLVSIHIVLVANGKKDTWKSFFSSLQFKLEFHIETCDKEVSLFKEFNK